MIEILDFNIIKLSSIFMRVSRGAPFHDSDRMNKIDKFILISFSRRQMAVDRTVHGIILPCSCLLQRDWLKRS